MKGRGLRSGPRDSQTRVSQCHVPDFEGFVCTAADAQDIN